MIESDSGRSFPGGVLARYGSIWLETPGQDVPGGGKALLFTDPVDILELRSISGLRDFFSELESRLEAGFFLAGWIGYEAGYGFERDAADYLRKAAPDEPLAWFGVYGEPGRFAGEEIEAFLAGEDIGWFSLPESIPFGYDRQEYAALVAAIRERLAAGDVYQVNLTGRFRFPFEGSPSALFTELRRSQPAAYSAFLNTGDRTVLSLSPELFFRCGDGFIETKPMKGTAPRGSTSGEDALKRQELVSCQKNRAENLMIVDLLRNDLGRICVPGSVVTENMFALETYPTLHQMVSTVRGKLGNEVELFDIFRALFPSGSVTGAPKIRAMELIDRLESSSRGIYTGAIGFMQPDRDMVFSVAIRTLELANGQGMYGSGSGIVWDSDPLQEYGECLLKARILTGAADAGCGIFESLLWNGRMLWASEHIERMRASAVGLGICFDIGLAERLLQDLDCELADAGGRYKVRLELSVDGSMMVTHEPVLASPSLVPLRLCLCGEPVDSSDILRYHKTTARSFFDRFYRMAQERGFDDVLFLNERGEVAESAIANVIVRKDGRYCTPPLSSGLLAGICRNYFLDTRTDCREQPLFPDDLLSADLVYLCNSVRGMRRAVYNGEVLQG
ncbi:MAG: aminodeoxychorismate synthase component I [Chlorobi bacterium]|nr:aminodeoxychorismate synthase component I [Chlorobiota bacterium]